MDLFCCTVVIITSGSDQYMHPWAKYCAAYYITPYEILSIHNRSLLSIPVSKLARSTKMSRLGICRLYLSLRRRPIRDVRSLVVGGHYQTVGCGLLGREY
ncbi:hypothetical protein BDV39DRAFT_171195 [Aspergillus sergii]|uniref:Uncharacterized protein n=1 Tax=Aspergillus sergii TaxID=1034303 RepID=A0A5N6X9X3_9EURO|nr:hypothetical protein BDV39DRAFT_171195 [Aspergillus sergii]